MGLDIGPKTVAEYADVIRRAKTVVWNGPMGVFEMTPFEAGTLGVAKAVAAVRGTTIIGGGDSVAAVTQAGVADKMTHISTGGGASLEFLGGRTLPGVAALDGRHTAAGQDPEGNSDARPGVRGQLENVQDDARGGRLRARVWRVRARRQPRGTHPRAALHRAGDLRGSGPQYRDRDRGSGSLLRTRRCVHRRSER